MFYGLQRSRVGLGALLVGYYDDQGRLCYAGKVGTGYTRETLLELRDCRAQLAEALHKQAGAAAVDVHARSVAQAYVGGPDWGADLQEAVRTAVSRASADGSHAT